MGQHELVKKKKSTKPLLGKAFTPSAGCWSLTCQFYINLFYFYFGFFFFFFFFFDNKIAPSTIRIVLI